MKTSLASRISIYLSAAALAAHATFIEGGFRIRDLSFFTELFLNWSDDLDSVGSVPQTTQISRYVSELVTHGFARRSTRNQTQTYRLTRLGLLDLLARISAPAPTFAPAQIFFRICFLSGYKPWLERLVKYEGNQFPPALAIELAALLDVDSIITHEIKRCEQSLKRLNKRIDDARQTSSLTTNRLATRVSFQDIVEEVEFKYPYELNSMKPLHELISSIAPDQRRWELEQGSLLRVSTIWEPQRALLQETLKQLREAQVASKRSLSNC